jgi:hypothetical protein
MAALPVEMLADATPMLSQVNLNLADGSWQGGKARSCGAVVTEGGRDALVAGLHQAV